MPVKNYASSINAAAAGSVDLEDGTLSYSATIAAAGAGTVAGSVGSIRLFTATIAAAAAGTVAGVRFIQFSAAIQASAAGTVIIANVTPWTATVSATAGGEVTAYIDGQGMTVQEAIEAIYRLWGLCICDGVEDCGSREEAIDILNASLQVLHSQAHELDYFNLTTITLSYASGDASKPLPQTVQNLLDRVRMTSPDSLALTRIDSSSEFDDYIANYYHGTAPSGPRAYHLESMADPGGNSVQMHLYLTPTPAETVTVALEASVLAPIYHWSDYSTGTPLSIPHKYANTLLVPILRKWASASRRFRRQELQPQIDQQFQIANLTLRLVSTEPPAQRRRTQS